MEEKFKDDIILNSIGALSGADAEKVLGTLHDAGFGEVFFASDLNNIVEKINNAVINNSSRLKTPSAGLKEKIMARIKTSPRDKEKHGFDFTFKDTNDWFDHPLVNAIKVKVLTVNRESNYALLLLKVPPNTEYPDHHHTSPEECLVLEGDLQAEGRVLGPGDFHHADPDTDHGKLFTRTGTVAMLMVNPADYGL